MRKSLLIRLAGGAVLAAAVVGLAFAKELPPICKDKERLTKAAIEISLICAEIATVDALAGIYDAYARHLQQQIDALGQPAKPVASEPKARLDDE